MVSSLGLAAYRALSKRRENRQYAPSEPRPRGELVWLHAADAGNILAVEELAKRLCGARYDLSVLITYPDRSIANGLMRQSREGVKIIRDQIPSEHPSAVDAFIAHWAPDMGLWTWGALRPNLVASCAAKAIPFALIDADSDGFEGRRERWMPDVTRSLLASFNTVMVRSTTMLRTLDQMGVDTETVDLTTPLQAEGQALPCDDDELAQLSAHIGGRPVWLAAQIQQGECHAVLSAHRHALRMSHRLLLILQTSNPAIAEDMAHKARSEGFRVAHWKDDEWPDDATQVLLADDADDLGLFYRLAPVSYLGSSLVPGGGGCNPYEAAALGSAVLYGPHVRRYLEFYTRLANVGAARIVSDAQSLGTAVTRLIAPDQAASMALAGWEVVSEGAALTDRIVDLVQDTLDVAERTH